MSRLLVSGLINIETTLRVDQFPIHYSPVRYPFWGVATTVSGVGYNVAKALTTLGNEVPFVSLVGRDPQGNLVLDQLVADNLSRRHIRRDLDQTPQSVILYDGEGRRQINVDLKDIQERTYPEESFVSALQGCEIAVLCNVNFSRPFLAIAKRHGIPIATDVHAVSNLDDDYNRDFMAAADILFMSDDSLPMPAAAWAERIMERYGPKILVIGLGGQGALLALRDPRRTVRLPAVRTRPVVNTVGAGDALFSAFLHVYARTRNTYAALKRAIVFASYKIGEKGAAEGFLTEAELERWYGETKDQFPADRL
ncbi:MAG: carbohydrate kinase family protein [Anaerolineae bacterium]